MRLNNGTVIVTVYICPAMPKKEIKTFMAHVFGKIKPGDNTSIIIVGDSNRVPFVAAARSRAPSLKHLSLRTIQG